ncbi:MAG: thioredoxin family protein [Spirochaetes bacterium]|nr:thioredoxin family protein [Spirochaetota bacterium]MBN2770431.1 thioredoxin family protein [Spirochaetota bacterium]
MLFGSCSSPSDDGEAMLSSVAKVEVPAQEKKTTDTAENDDVSERESSSGKLPIVTFIELGSVNCVPCKMMQPVMDQVKATYGDKVDVVFYDVWTEEERSMAEKYRIRAIPTQVFLDVDGNEYYRHTGFFPFEELDKVLKAGGVR